MSHSLNSDYRWTSEDGAKSFVRKSVICSMVQVCAPEYDCEILRRKSFNVNMRLFKVNEEYKKVIQSICQYLLDNVGKPWADNSAEKCVAAPVLGIPLRIIAVSLTTEYKPFVMINPEIVAQSDTLISGRTNCGAIRLKNQIEVNRPSWISVKYCDYLGIEIVKDRILKSDGGHMIQHEIDHLDGILITDRFIQQGHTPDELASLWPGVPSP